MAALDWKKIVASVAPTLATALGGPLAGVAVSELGRQLLGNENADANDVERAVITGGADALVKVREAENSFKIRMKELDIDLEKVHAGDRASAREREARTGDVWTPRSLAAIVVIGFFWMVWMVLTGKVDGKQNDPVLIGFVGTVIGYVSAKADQVISYYFGSSRGSDDKTAIMAKKLSQ